MTNIFIGLKKTCLGVLDSGEREKDNGTCLKEGGGIEMSTTVLPFALLRLKYLLQHLAFGRYHFFPFQQRDPRVIF